MILSLFCWVKTYQDILKCVFCDVGDASEHIQMLLGSLHLMIAPSINQWRPFQPGIWLGVIAKDSVQMAALWTFVPATHVQLIPSGAACRLTHYGLVTAYGDRFGSKLAQLMARCLTAPNHYLNQCWLIISEVLWQFRRKSWKHLSFI